MIISGLIIAISGVFWVVVGYIAGYGAGSKAQQDINAKLSKYDFDGKQ